MGSRYGGLSFRFRNGTNSRRIRENIAETVPLDLLEATSDLLIKIFKSLSEWKPGNTKNLGHLNNMILILCNCDDALSKFSMEDIMICLKPALVSDVKEVRAACIRALRYLVNDANAVALLTRLHMDSFVIKCLDISHFNEVERIQCLRLIRKIFCIAQNERKSGYDTESAIIPKSFALCVMSISADGAVERDRVYRTCLAILCELVVLEPLLVIENGGILILLRGILECHMYRRINEALCISLGILLNHPASRNLLALEFSFGAIFAPYTDIMYRLHADIEESQIREEKEMRFSASKMAIVSVLRSWSGLLHLCQTSALKSFLNTLLTPDVLIKRAAMSVLFEIFCMNEPSYSKDFSEALASIGPKVYQESWQLTNNFIVGEGKWFLHSLCNERLNLTNCYMAVLLAIFIESEIIQRMVDVMMSSDEEASISASIFLGGLLNLCSKLQTVPQSREIFLGRVGSCKESLPNLMEKAISENASREEKLQASNAVNRLQRIHLFLKSPPTSHSVYFDELILRIKASKTLTSDPQSSFLIPSVSRNGTVSDSDTPFQEGTLVRRNRSIAIVRSFSSEQTVSRIKETKVLIEKKYQSWNWEAIASFLVEGWTKKAATLKEPRFIGSDDTEFQFVKKLVAFYTPHEGEFCKLDRAKNGENGQELHVQSGCHLIRYLSCTAGEGMRILCSFLSNILNYLSNLVKETDGMNKATSSYLSSCAREYYLLLGSITMWHHGSQILVRSGVFDFFFALANDQTHESLLKLIVSSLSYSNKSQSYKFLEKVLVSCNEGARLYATSYMRILLRAKMPGFITWGVNLLITQLYDQSQLVANEALDIVIEACSNQEYLDVIVKLRPSLLHHGEKGALLVCRFASHPFGFDYLLNGADYLSKELQRWWESANDSYVARVEEMLNLSLTCFEKPNQQGGFVRRSGIKKIVQPVHVPSHLYGELCQHQKGCELLKENNVVSRLMEKLRKALALHEGISSGIDGHKFSLLFYQKIAQQLVHIKSCIWALCHVASSSLGLKLIMPLDVLQTVINLAEHSPVYSIRGTCFYCLSVVSQTVPGAEQLKKLGWQSTLRKVWSSIEEAGRGHMSGESSTEKPDASPACSNLSSEKSSLSAMSNLSQFTPSPLDSRSRKIDSTLFQNESNTTVKQFIIRGSLDDVFSDKFPQDSCKKCSPNEQSTRKSASLETVFCKSCGTKTYSLDAAVTPLERRISLSAPTLVDRPNESASRLSSSFYDDERYVGVEGPDRSWCFNKIEDISAIKYVLERYTRYKNAASNYRSEAYSVDRSMEISESLQLAIEDSMEFIGIAVPADISGILEPKTSNSGSDVPLLHLLQRRPQKRFHSKLTKYFADSDETRSPNQSQLSTTAFLEDMPQSGGSRKEAVHREIIKLITNLGNSFANKADETALLILKEKFPGSFNSVALYYAVSDILAEYNFRLTARRFIQELFHDVPFTEVYEEAREVLRKYEGNS